jgi:hypothetical protein
VAAVRVYTTACYRLINEPLRRIIKERQALAVNPEACEPKPHPLPFTTFLLYRAVKKLRACNLHKNDIREYTRYLWRGMKDLTISKDFEKSGGTHTACMSTSKNLAVVKHFCDSREPLLFRIKVPWLLCTRVCSVATIYMIYMISGLHCKVQRTDSNRQYILYICCVARCTCSGCDVFMAGPGHARLHLRRVPVHYMYLCMNIREYMYVFMSVRGHVQLHLRRVPVSGPAFLNLCRFQVPRASPLSRCTCTRTRVHPVFAHS